MGAVAGEVEADHAVEDVQRARAQVDDVVGEAQAAEAVQDAADVAPGNDRLFGVAVLGQGQADVGVGEGLVWCFGALYPAFPVATPLWAVITVILLSLGVGAVFGVLPALKATRLDPIQALTGR